MVLRSSQIPVPHIEMLLQYSGALKYPISKCYYSTQELSNTPYRNATMVLRSSQIPHIEMLLQYSGALKYPISKCYYGTQKLSNTPYRNATTVLRSPKSTPYRNATTVLRSSQIPHIEMLLRYSGALKYPILKCYNGTQELSNTPY